MVKTVVKAPATHLGQVTPDSTWNMLEVMLCGRNEVRYSLENV